MKKYIPIFFLLLSCSQSKTNNEGAKEAGNNQSKNQLIGNWKLVLNPGEKAERDPMWYLRSKESLIFINDSSVNTRRPYFSLDRNGYRDRFIGTITSYKFDNDSLKIYDLTESIWEKGSKLTKLSDDTLLLIDFDNKKGYYVRQQPKQVHESSFDQIVVSNHGGWGTVSEILINKNGDGVFHGIGPEKKIDYYQFTFSKEKFVEFESNFQRAVDLGVSRAYLAEWTDATMVSTSLCKENKIMYSIMDWGEVGTQDLVIANILLNNFYRDLQLNKIYNKEIPSHLDLHLFRFQNTKEDIRLTDADGFLLWNYLRNGSPVKTAFESKFNLTFVGNHIKKQSDVEKIQKIETDGRYFRFFEKGKEPFTIDIGFNFVDDNLKEFKLREMEMSKK